MAAMARPSFSHLDEADKIQMEKDRKGPANYDDDEEEEYKTTFKRRESERACRYGHKIGRASCPYLH